MKKHFHSQTNFKFYFRKTLTGLFPAEHKLTSVKKTPQGSISNAELAKAS